MAKLRHVALGLAVGLGLSGTPERAAASNLPAIESSHADIPFETLAKSQRFEDIVELIDHAPDWGYREHAAETAMDLAGKYPGLFIKRSQMLLDSGIPWVQDALRTAFQSTDEEYGLYSVFRHVDTRDPRILRLLNTSIEQRYRDIVWRLWHPQHSEALTPAEQQLLKDAVTTLAVHDPIMYLRDLSRDHDAFVQLFPDATSRERLDAIAITHILVSGKQQDLTTLLYYAESSGDTREAIARNFGWSRFLDQCSEQIPGEVFYSLQSGRRTFLPLTFEKKRMELYRHAAERAPDKLIYQWPLTKDQKFVLTPADEEEFLRLVGQSLVTVISENIGTFDLKLLTPDVLTQFPEVHDALLRVAERDPAKFLDTFSQSDPLYTPQIDITPYREIAARSAIEKRVWANNTPRDQYTFDSQGKATFISKNRRNTVEYFSGLPNEGALTEAWFRGAAIDTPATTLEPLFTQSTRPQWIENVLRTDLLYLLDGTPNALDSFLTQENQSYQSATSDPRERLTFNDLELMLGARAKDDFAKAVKDANVLLRDRGTHNPKLAYQLLWILEQNQPYEFDAWVKANASLPIPNELTSWQGAVTKEQWSGLVAHAKSIGSKKEYEKLATSTVGVGFRLNAAVLEGVLGMNYTHRLHTTVTIQDPLGPIPGENFISIPMIAFETIATSEPFNAYIDTHAGERLSFVNICSTAQATWRRLRDLHLEPTPANIERALQDVTRQWDQIKNIEIFGPHTQLIAFAHAEERFQNSEIIEHLLIGHGGNASQVLFQGKGEGDKSAILDAIGKRKSAPVTIVFSGHGNADVIALSDRVKITPSELGDALISSGNIRNTRLVLGSCYSYDFADAVLRYLREKRVDASGLIVITESNQDALGFGGGKDIESRHLEAVNLQSPGAPITVETFRKAEKDIWLREDPSITVGLPLSAGWMTGLEVADSD